MDEAHKARYLRQVIFAPLGSQGQERLLGARVLISGCGATGSMMANTLARSGVGHMRIIDRDFIELNNLQRQVLFDEADVAAGVPKAVAAARHLRQINSSISVEPIVADLNADNIEDLISGADLVLDGTDNFETRYLINDACVKHGTPWIYVGAVGSYGATMTIVPGDTACFRCLFRNAPAPGTLATCDTFGVIAPIVGLVSSIACAEAIKLLSGRGKLGDGLVHVDIWENSFETFHVGRAQDCPACVRRQFDFLEHGESGEITSRLCGRSAVQVRARQKNALNLPELAERLSQVGEANYNQYLVHFRTGEYEITIFDDGRAIVKGTEDEAVAKSLYAKYIGM